MDYIEIKSAGEEKREKESKGKKGVVKRKGKKSWERNKRALKKEKSNNK